MPMVNSGIVQRIYDFSDQMPSNKHQQTHRYGITERPEISYKFSFEETNDWKQFYSSSKVGNPTIE
jgi:hypothetical protein